MEAHLGKPQFFFSGPATKRGGGGLKEAQKKLPNKCGHYARGVVGGGG